MSMRGMFQGSKCPNPRTLAPFAKEIYCSKTPHGHSANLKLETRSREEEINVRDLTSLRFSCVFPVALREQMAMAIQLCRWRELDLEHLGDLEPL